MNRRSFFAFIALLTGCVKRVKRGPGSDGPWPPVKMQEMEHEALRLLRGNLLVK